MSHFELENEHTACRLAILIFLSTASTPVTVAPILANGWTNKRKEYMQGENKLLFKKKRNSIGIKYALYTSLSDKVLRQHNMH